MCSKETILDLASSKTWKSRAGKIIDVIFPAAVQELIRQREPERIFPDTFSYVLQSFQEAGEFVDLGEINARLGNAFAKSFTHWRGYHSCRPSSLESYQKNGILPLTREFLMNEALRVFKGHAPEDKIRKVAAEFDLETREGDICLLSDPLLAFDASCNHYLRSGSEALIGMACELSLSNRGILAAQGKPVLIQCKVPLGKVKKEFRELLYRYIVTQYFQHEMSKGKIGIEIREFCFRTSEKIPPSNIEKFIPIDDHRLIKRWNDPNH